MAYYKEQYQTLEPVNVQFSIGFGKLSKKWWVFHLSRHVCEDHGYGSKKSAIKAANEHLAACVERDRRVEEFVERKGI